MSRSFSGARGRRRRSVLGVNIAVGAAFVAAMIPLAQEAKADTEIDPFQDLFGDTGINAWTTAADNFLGSIVVADPLRLLDPTGLAGNLDTSVDTFLFNFGNQVDPFSIIAYRLEPSLPLDQLPFSMDPAGFGYFLDGGVPLNATGDFALGLDYMLYASGIGATLDPIIFTLFLDPILYGP
jgi:hypothetical protein